MTVNTKGIFNRRVSEYEIAKFIKDTYDAKNISIIPTFFPGDDLNDFVKIKFEAHSEERIMYVFQNSGDEFKYVDNSISNKMTLISLGCWGASKDIVRSLISHFGGGWVINNDCDGDWEKI